MSSIEQAAEIGIKGAIDENRRRLRLRRDQGRSRGRSGKDADLPLQRLPDRHRHRVSHSISVPGSSFEINRAADDLHQDHRRQRQPAGAGVLPHLRFADLFDDAGRLACSRPTRCGSAFCASAINSRRGGKSGGVWRGLGSPCLTRCRNSKSRVDVDAPRNRAVSAARLRFALEPPRATAQDRPAASVGTTGSTWPRADAIYSPQTSIRRLQD